MSGIVRYNRTRTSGLIKGVAGVPAVSGDKSPATAGDTWYNSSSNTLRCYIPISAWSAGGNLGTARNDCMGFGTSGAAGVAGGNHPALGTTEEYNGSSWGAGGATNTDAHGTAQGGLLAAGIKACGYTTSVVAGAETYDGSSWTAIPDCTDTKYEPGGLGTATAFAVVGGDPGNSTVTNTTFLYNGTAWSTGGTLNTPGNYVNCTGTTTAGLRIGGLNPAPTTIDVVEEYNGTDWTTVTAYPTTITHRACAGLQTDTLVAAGKTNNATSAVTDDCYSYDGTNWTQTTDYPHKSFLGGMSKNDATASSDTIHFGGNNNTASPQVIVALTFEWLDTVSNQTISTE